MSVDASPSRAIVPFVPPAARFTLRLRHGLWVVGAGLAIGVCTFGVHAIESAASASRLAATQSNAQVLAKLQEDIGHLKTSVDTLRTAADLGKQDESLRGLKKSVDTLKQQVDLVRANDNVTLAQLSTKIDKADHDPTPKLAEIVSRLDKLDHDPAKVPDGQMQKLADLTSRLDRIERQVSSATPTGSLPPTPPVRAPAIATPAKAVQGPVAKPETVAAVSSSTEPRSAPAKPRPVPTVDAWVLRDVYDGMALVEARRGGLREVEPGEFLPGAGQIRSIERRGRAWVVLTSQGVIANNTF